ncbi:MAG TPA: serine hydrolase domain-containing protein [Pseudonocardia sp.]
MTPLTELLDRHLQAGALPGAVALVASGDDVEVAVIGDRGLGGAPMTRDSIFRVASVTKPITAAVVMTLVDDGTLALDDPIATWLPELASPMVVRTPEAAVDDVVPARRPITVGDLLTFRGGHGFPADFALPAVAPLLAQLRQGPPAPQQSAPVDDWMRTLATIPLLHQPGDTWLYNTGSDILGVLVSRATAEPFDDVLAARIFGPLGMSDTGFHVPAGRLDRFTTSYQPDPDGSGLTVVDRPDGQWSTRPAFPSGAGGLVSTVDDLLAFQRMLLAGGVRADGTRLLNPESVTLMTTDHLTARQRAASRLFLEGQGWGFGGSVDVERIDPWNVPGRYGWVGGSGTAAHIIPGGGVTILLTQVEMTSPTPPTIMREFWAVAAQATAATPR